MHGSDYNMSFSQEGREAPVCSMILIQSLGPAESPQGFTTDSSPGGLWGSQKTIPHVQPLLFFLMYPALPSSCLQNQGTTLAQGLHSVATVKVSKLIQYPHGGKASLVQNTAFYCNLEELLNVRKETE